MSDLKAEIYLKGPFAISGGLSFETLGQVLKSVKDDRAYGRTPVMNGKGETFHVILYEDDSWRISTAQLEMFPDLPSGDSQPSLNDMTEKVNNATKSPHTLY